MSFQRSQFLALFTAEIFERYNSIYDMAMAMCNKLLESSANEITVTHYQQILLSKTDFWRFPIEIMICLMILGQVPT